MPKDSSTANSLTDADEVPFPSDQDEPPTIDTYQPVSDEDVDEIFGRK